MDSASTTTPKWADVWIRTVSAVVLAPAVLFDIWLGGLWFEILIAFLGVLMAHEWTIIAHGRSTSQFALHALAAICAAFIPRESGVELALAAVFLISAIAYAGVVFGPRPKSWWNYVGVPYVSLPVLAIVTLRNDPEWGLHAIMWLVACVWATDICAYFAGRLIGGPKLLPSISPKKTWAGLGGAIAGAALASVIYAWFVAPWVLPLAVLAGFLAVIAQAGDMMESAFKRYYGVKDSGHLIPGHGGIMDRVDGMIAVVVVAGLIGYFRNPESAAAGLFLW